MGLKNLCFEEVLMVVFQDNTLRSTPDASLSQHLIQIMERQLTGLLPSVWMQQRTEVLSCSFLKHCTCYYGWHEVGAMGMGGREQWKNEK